MSPEASKCRSRPHPAVFIFHSLQVYQGAWMWEADHYISNREMKITKTAQGLALEVNWLSVWGSFKRRDAKCSCLGWSFLNFCNIFAIQLLWGDKGMTASIAHKIDSDSEHWAYSHTSATGHRGCWGFGVRPISVDNNTKTQLPCHGILFHTKAQKSQVWNHTPHKTLATLSWKLL